MGIGAVIWVLVVASSVLLAVFWDEAKVRGSNLLAIFEEPEYAEGFADREEALDYLKAHPEDFSLVARSAGGEAGISYKPEEPNPLASTKKIVVLAAYAKEVSEGRVDPDEKIPVSEWEKYYVPDTDGGAHPASLERLGVPTDGDGAASDPEATASLDEVASAMVSESDNAAADYLLERLGPEKIQAVIEDENLMGRQNVLPISGSFLVWNGRDGEGTPGLAGMSREEYEAEVRRAAESYAGGEYPDEWREGSAPVGSLVEQRKMASQYETRGTAKDYARIMSEVVAGEFISPEASEIMRRHLEWPMKAKSNKEKYRTSERRGVLCRGFRRCTPSRKTATSPGRRGSSSYSRGTCPPRRGSEARSPKDIPTSWRRSPPTRSSRRRWNVGSGKAKEIGSSERGNPVMEAKVEERASTGGKSRWLGWKVFGALVAAGTAASLATVPYAMTLSGSGGSPEIPAWAFVVGTVIQGVVLTAIAAGLGLWLGGKVGLGAWDVRGLVAGESGMGRRIVRSLPLALALGVVGAVAVQLIGWGFTLVSPEIMRRLEDVEMWAPWEGFLVAVGAGISEEIWLRLGVMGVLAWLLARIAKLAGRTGAEGEAPTAWAVWTAMVGAALLFGAMHLPLAASLGDGLTFAFAANVVSMNAVLGLVFGWLYWKRGLVAAMAAHFATNIVLKVVLVAAMPVFT